jgi:hypothetical protein
MTTRRPEFVSRRTQRALRSLASEIDVKAIEGLWRDQGFVPVSELHYEDSSLRRTTFESSSAAVDWTDVAQVERAPRVFESQLRWLARQEWHRASSFDEVRELLDDDGFELDERLTWRYRCPTASPPRDNPSGQHAGGCTPDTPAPLVRPQFRCRPGHLACVVLGDGLGPRAFDDQAPPLRPNLPGWVLIASSQPWSRMSRR